MRKPTSKTLKTEKKLKLEKVIISKLDSAKMLILLGDDASTNAACHYTQQTQVQTF